MNLNRLEAYILTKNINRFFVIIVNGEEYEIIKYNCDFVLIMKITKAHKHQF